MLKRIIQISLIIGLIAVSLFYFSCGHNKGKILENWGKAEGEMNWRKAKITCEYLGMRLPTRLEIRGALKQGYTESWKSDGIGYWTSEEFSEDNSYYLDLNQNKMIVTSKINPKQARCIH